MSTSPRRPSLDTINVDGAIGYHSHEQFSSWTSFRRSLKHTLDSLWFEIIVIVLVVLYAIIIFVDLTLTTINNPIAVDEMACQGTTATDYATNATLSDMCKETSERDALYYLDLVFLSIFIVEICLRLLGFGLAFLRDAVQVVDMIVVVLAFVTALVPEELMASFSFLNILRIVRLFRLAVVISKLQRSRDATAMRRKRAMFKRLGAPVEKVLTFLTDLRGRIDVKRDQDNIDWMMEIIASDELYAVSDFDEDALQKMQGGGSSTAAMSQFLSSETGLAKRRVGSLKDDGSAAGGQPGQEKSAEGTEGAGASHVQHAGHYRRKLSAATLQLWAGAAIAGTGLSSKLQRLATSSAWAFDIFDFELACEALPLPGKGQSATLMCYYLLEQHGVLDNLRIDRSKMLAWLSAVDRGYDRANPYHNALHAADVCATVDFFLRQPNVQRMLTPLDLLAALIAAVIHDLGHQGVNNTYLEATRDPLAITYNDISVLENHHIAGAFKLLSSDNCDWTAALPEGDYRELRDVVIMMVLGTDMRAHFEHLTKFKSKVAGEGFGPNMERKDMKTLLAMSLHAADICNPAKPQAIATEWAKRSMTEFFLQGDREAERGLPVSPFMDRNKVPLSATIVNCQIGFINVLVKPLLSEWAAFLGAEAERDIILTLDSNLRLWEADGGQLTESWGDQRRSGVGAGTTDGSNASAGQLGDKLLSNRSKGASQRV